VTTDIPTAPAGSSAAAERLWSSVLEQYDLEQHELQLLVAAVRTITTLDKLDAELRHDGVLVDSTKGAKAHPAAVESRQQAIALARILAALRLPAGADGDQQAGARPQRRVGVRGIYKVGA
jgi:hypothetical protein